MKIQYREGPAEIGLSLPRPGKKSTIVAVKRREAVEVPDGLGAAMLAKRGPVHWERAVEKTTKAAPKPAPKKEGGDA